MKTIKELSKKERASAIIIAHNHPIDELKPSNEDIDVTNRIK